MTRRHSAHQTQWAAQFAVASELCRRGYQVALTLGNHPMVDLMVVSPGGTSFLVDVKGQYKSNFWPVSPKKEENKLLFYVLAFVPDPQEGQNRYTVLTKDDVNQHIAENTATWRARKPERANKNDPMPAVSPQYARSHEGGWDKLPR